MVELKESNNMSITIFIILLLICFALLYESSFSKQNFLKINQINHDKHINLKNLPLCIDEVDPLQHYLLCDYYIASSYNTPLIQNQKNDYVSIEMITKVLLSGARYIELGICKQNMSEGAIPVIGVGSKIGDWILSANYIDVDDVFLIISRMAFKLSEKRINYPLFIYLKIYTDDNITLNILADIIKKRCGDLLVNVNKYVKFPIMLEKLCNLLNKIVIFAEGNYQASNMKDLVVPLGKLVNFIKFDNIDAINGVPKDAKTYNKILSSSNQEESLNHFKQKYPDYKHNDFDVTSDLFKKLKNDPKIVDPLTHYNKVGLTIITPHSEEDTFSLNYDFKNAMSYGAQFMTMNYQLNDEHMINYLKMFENSSFILKPAGLRFHRTRKHVDDISNMYPYEIKPYLNADISFMKLWNNKVVAIESMFLPGYFITAKGEKLIFERKRTNNGGKFIKNQLFIINNSKYKKVNRGIMINILTNSNKYIVTDGDFFYIKRVKNEPNLLKDATLIPIKPMCQEKDYYSFGTVPGDNINVMGSYKYMLKQYKKTKEEKLSNQACFKLHDIPHEKYLIFKHIASGKLLKLGPSNTLILKGTKITDTHRFLISDNYTEQDETTGEFKRVTLMGNNQRYLYRTNNNLVNVNNNAVINNTLMQIIFDGVAWTIINKNSYLTSSDNITLSFKQNRPVISPEKRDSKNRIIKASVFGPALGNQHRFQIQQNYSI